MTRCQGCGLCVPVMGGKEINICKSCATKEALQKKTAGIKAKRARTYTGAQVIKHEREPVS